ncbi:MAG: YdhR family protein [Lysobacterales bacterium]
MSTPQMVLLVKFKSALSLEEINRVIDSRIEDFRQLQGLQQKYYLLDSASGELAGLYLWESKEDLQSYNESELRKTIAKAYQAIGEPRVEVFSVLKPLRE